MRATAEIIARLFLIVILSAFTGFAGCSNDAEDQSSVTGRLQSGIVEGAATLLEGEEEGEEENPIDSTGGAEAAGRQVEMEEYETDESSLIYTREYYSYRVRKKQDPFRPLLTQGGQLDGLTLNELALTGILWGEEQSMAVMEDSQGKGYLMRVGDKIAGARLVAIREDAAVFRVVEFGVVHNIEKELFIQEEKPI